MQPLLDSFIKTFQKAVTREVEAVQRQYGSTFEIRLSNGREVERTQPTAWHYRFTMSENTSQLASLMECTLKVDQTEVAVTIISVEHDQLTLACQSEIALNAQSYTLIVFPWFLYERLHAALESLRDTTRDYHVTSALTLFGKLEPERTPQSAQPRLEHLNESQHRAIQLCCESSLAFIWGPPGTGKTTTLGHIVAELLSHNHRILITSTTNAAVDQVLARLATLEATQPYFDLNLVVRMGQASGESYGASLGEATARQNTRLKERLRSIEERRIHLQRQSTACAAILDKLIESTQQTQLGLFGNQTPLFIDFSSIFASRLARTLQRLPVEGQIEAVRSRARRLADLVAGYHTRMERYRKEFAHQEEAVLSAARVVLATTSSVYVNPRLADERFDVVIVEEAAMTLLPTLFFCACLARHKVVIVGDPKQLPAIIQADDAFVRKYLGMNIFEVTNKDLRHDPQVVMLDVQYRMHPQIGALVSNLYYDRRLQSDPTTVERTRIAATAPYPTLPLIVIDTAGQTTCATQPGQFSRFNDLSAQVCVDLALEAARNGIESIGIITPYALQSRMIRERLARFPTEAAQIECRTVHRFQGSERDLIILDTVDTAPLTPGVLLAGTRAGSAAENLVNVSISRARGKLIIIADVAYFRRMAPTSALSRMLDQATEIGTHIVLNKER